MLVAVNGFGSIWSYRARGDSSNRGNYTDKAAYFNTTGVMVGGKIRHRSQVYGAARFNGNSGFTPHLPDRMINRVFECEDPCAWNGGNRLTFSRLSTDRQRPECFLVTVTEQQTGWLDRDGNWKAPAVHLLSFSESNSHQEAMLLMPAFTWVRGQLGLFVLEPDSRSPWCARLMQMPAR